MRYVVDHDLHIHTKQSPCSSDPLQSPERIWQYAKENGFSTVCLADHFWDELVPAASDWYEKCHFACICESLSFTPPKDGGVRYLFGCETDVDKYFHLGVSEERMEFFDFIVIPTTHMHMTGLTVDPEDGAPERRAELYVKRLDAVLSMDLPFEKVGIAHLTCPLLSNVETHLDVLDMVSDEVFHELFARAAKKKTGIELNFEVCNYKSEEDLARVLRPYRIAKEEGCLFYFGSDAHHEDVLLRSKDNFEQIVTLLDLTEEEKFKVPFKANSPYLR